MKLWPRSLRVRLILTVTLTMVVTQLVMVIGASQKFSGLQRTERATQMARQIAFIKPIIEKQGSVPQDVVMPRFFRKSELSGVPADMQRPLEPSSGFPSARPHRTQVAMTITTDAPPSGGDPELLAKMHETVSDVVQVTYHEKSDPFSVGPHRAYRIEAWTKLDNKRFLKTVFDEPADQRRSFGISPYYDLLLRGGIGLLLALLITSWIAKPLARLAEAADDTMPGGEVKSAISGPLIARNANARPIFIHEEPAEIAHALAAFERLRTRIGAMVGERTTMLTALAHDLRTPITRLMLRLEMTSDTKLRDGALRDLAKMQTLIARTLDFLRSAEQGQRVTKVDVLSAIRAAVASLGADMTQHVTIEGEATLVIANDWGVERLFANLIDNAVKYGEHALVAISRDDQYGIVTISDHGQGVPTESLARLIEPFYRVDTSRNLDEGGAGLGMSIVDNLVRSYGGAILIRNASSSGSKKNENGETGLVVEIRLPLAP